jgi:hypothetical protein
MTLGPLGLAIGFFFLQVGGVQQHQPTQLAGGGGCDDFAAKSSLDQQRQAAAMVEMRVRQEHIVDGARIKAKGFGVLLVELAAPLMHATVDQNPQTSALDQVTRAGDAAIGAMERQFHDDALGEIRNSDKAAEQAWVMIMRAREPPR